MSRPIDSHEDQGREAYYDDGKLEASPYPRGSLRDACWRFGWLDAAFKDPLALPDDDNFDEGINEHELMRADARSDRARILYAAEDMLPSLEACEAAAGPSEEWPTNCFAIATAIYEAGLVAELENIYGRARVAYGCFTGHVSKDSVFSQGVARHGWIEFDDGLVLDPTRWVFSASEPKIRVFTIEDYDLAASRLRQSVFGQRPSPAYSLEEKIYRWDVNDPEVTNLVHELLRDQSHIKADSTISLHQTRWLGGLPLGMFGPHAAAVYAWFQRQNLQAMVPLDNRRFVEETIPRIEIEMPNGMTL